MAIKVLCKQDPFEWHSWFAWHPIWIPTEGKRGRVCVTRAWWVPLERRLRSGWGDSSYEYRIPR